MSISTCGQTYCKKNYNTIPLIDINNNNTPIYNFAYDKNYSLYYYNFYLSKYVKLCNNLEIENLTKNNKIMIFKSEFKYNEQKLLNNSLNEIITVSINNNFLKTLYLNTNNINYNNGLIKFNQNVIVKIIADITWNKDLYNNITRVFQIYVNDTLKKEYQHSKSSNGDEPKTIRINDIIEINSNDTLHFKFVFKNTFNNIHIIPKGNIILYI